MEMMYHRPVLLSESIAGLCIRPASIYVDATFGGGGHSKKILNQLDDKSLLFAFDQDEDVYQNNIEDSRFKFIPHNFKYLKRFLRFYGVEAVDGILADLGVSSHQFDTPDRGFSIRFDGPLDMRMNQQQEFSAKDVVNSYSASELADVFFNFGELRNARAIAQHVCQNRIEQIETTLQFNRLLSDFLPSGNENKVLAKIYQALRVEVNNEVAALQDFLTQCKDVLKVGGRLSVISYHSIEDRLVKRYIQNGNFESEPYKDAYGIPQLNFKKCGGLQVPSQDEIINNNRARSAKLRVAERI